MITAGDGDTLWLKNLNVAILATLGADFTFHASGEATRASFHSRPASAQPNAEA